MANTNLQRRFLSPAIEAEYVRQQTEMGWPGRVPAFCEFPVASGENHFMHWEDLKVGICEQAVEFHIRRARKAIDTFGRTQTIQAARKAAKAILYARIYKAKALLLMGAAEVTENDLPFANMTDDVETTNDH